MTHQPPMQSLYTCSSGDVIAGVPRDMIPDAWPLVADRIACVIDNFSHGEETLEEIHEELLSGKAQLWVIGQMRAVVVTQIGEAVPAPICTIAYCHGLGIEDWAEDFIAMISEWAKGHGAGKLRIVGRPGWAKVLRETGMKPTHITLCKAL